MEERPLNFKQNESKEIVELSKKNKKEALKNALDLYSIVGMLHEKIKKDKLDEGFAEMSMSLIEHQASYLLSALNYDSQIKKDIEKRYAEIKAANTQNHELRKQLGEKVSAEDIREFIKTANNGIYDWGKKCHLGFASDKRFGSYGVRIELSLCGGFIDDEDVKQLETEGFELQKESKYHYNMVHSTKNIDLITEKINKKYPSAKITEIKLQENKGLKIDRIFFFVSDFEDLIEKKDKALQ